MKHYFIKKIYGFAQDSLWHFVYSLFAQARQLAPKLHG